MKWLFLLMLSVNIAIFVWGVQREKDTPTELDPRFRSIGEIELIAKADIEDHLLAQITEKENVDEPSASSEQPSGGEEAISSTTLDASAIDATPKVELSTEGKDAVDIIANSSHMDSEAQKMETSPKLNLTEKTGEPPRPQAEELETAETETIAVPEVFCWTLGPISQRASAVTILDAIEKKDAFASLREEIQKDITGFWVVLPPYESTSAAIEAVNKLKARGVSDVQRFYKGELQNGVSLGIYNQRFNAEKRKAQIETKGFSPEVLPRYKEELRYWIDYRSPSEIDVRGDMPSGYRALAAAQQQCNAQLD